MNYEPSRLSQRIVICLVAAVAVVITIYMSLYQLGLIDHVWDPVFGDQTQKVLNSDLSHTMKNYLRIPDALMGALAYLGDIIFAIAGSSRRWQEHPWMVLLFGINVIPLGIVSAVLIFMQGAVVGFWCFPCFITAIISVVLIFLSFNEVSCCVLYLHGVWKKNRSYRLLWKTLYGKPSQVAYEAGVEMIRKRSQ